VKVTALVAAAGSGLRLKTKTLKPLVLIDKKPIIIHTLKKLSSHPLIKEIIIVFNPAYKQKLENLLKRERIKKVKEIVKGGKTRTQSVKNGLERVKDADLVLIHDGARPFIENKTITQAIKAALKCGAAIVGVPLKSTIKRIKPESLEVDCTLRREQVWEIQTPQVFKKSLIVRAYNMAGKNADMPDDSFLVERLGRRVALVKGSSLNIKITTPDDLVLAKAIIKNN